MERVILDFIDKCSKGYIVFYTNKNNTKRGNILIPYNIFKQSKNAKLWSSNAYTIHLTKSTKDDIKVTVQKVPFYRNRYPERYSLKLVFNNKELYVPDSILDKKAKSYCFQTSVDIKVYDAIGQLVCSNYKLLKNYDTKSKAAYMINKFGNQFARLYDKWLITDKIGYDISNNIFELFHSDLIYEHEFMFKTKDGTGIAIYNFAVNTVEKDT